MYIKKDTGRVFVCTDLHGNIHTLHKMLNDVAFDVTTDLLICCGDLIDRGPASRETLEHFLYDETGAYISIRGNHDQFLIDTLNKDDPSGNWVYFNGGQWILNEEEWKVKDLAIDAKARLPFYLTLDFMGTRYGFVHAEVPSEFTSWEQFTKTVDQETTEVYSRMGMWNREIIRGEPAPILPDVTYVFHGHTVLDRPTIVGNRVYLDTGFVFKRLLTLIEITHTGALRANFRDKYAPRILTKGDVFVIAE